MTTPVFDAHGWCHDMDAAPRDADLIMLWVPNRDRGPDDAPGWAVFAWWEMGGAGRGFWSDGVRLHPTAWRPAPPPPEAAE